MPLSKSDDPKADKPDTYLPASDPKAKAAKQDILDAGAGAPETQDAAVEALPEKDEVQVNIKKAMQAETGQEEAQAKAAVVEASPDASETPSGGALEEVKDIEDNVERGEEYARQKAMRRHGYVTPDLQKKDK